MSSTPQLSEVEDPELHRKDATTRAKRERPAWLSRPWKRNEAKAPAGPNIILRPYVRPRQRWIGVAALIALAFVVFIYGYAFGVLAPAQVIFFFFPILFLGALCIWALPETGEAPIKLLQWFFFLHFLVMPLWPNYLAIDLPGLPWITLVRVTVFPLSFVLLVALSVSKTFRSELGLAVGSVPLLWKGVAAFTVYQALSIGLSNMPMFSINHFISDLTGWTFVFFAGAWVFSKPGRTELWISLLLGVAIILSLIAAREFMNGEVLWAGHIPSFLAIQDDSVTLSLSAKMRAGTERYRAQATYSTSLGLAEYMALCTPFALHFMAGPYKLIVRLGGALLLPLLFNTIVLTDARLGMLGFLLSCLVYTFFWGVRRWRSNKAGLIGPVIVLAYPAISVAFLAAIIAVPRLRMMTLGGGNRNSSTQARQEEVRRGLPMIFEHPFGHGIARGGSALGYTNAKGTLSIDTYWLLIGLDYGIFGFIIFYGMVWAAIIAGSRAVLLGPRDREQTLVMPLAVALVVWFVIKAVYSDAENQSTVFMMLGAISALVYRIKLANGEVPAKSLAAR